MEDAILFSNGNDIGFKIEMEVTKFLKDLFIDHFFVSIYRCFMLMFVNFKENQLESTERSHKSKCYTLISYNGRHDKCVNLYEHDRL